MARNKYPEETVARILDAAQRLFLEKGYDQTTIQEIVDHLGGLSKVAVYHHFKYKEDILDAVCDRMFLQNNPFEAVRRRTDLNGLQKLREAIRLNLADSAAGTDALLGDLIALGGSAAVSVYTMIGTVCRRIPRSGNTSM